MRPEAGEGDQAGGRGRGARLPGDLHQSCPPSRGRDQEAGRTLARLLQWSLQIQRYESEIAILTIVFRNVAVLLILTWRSLATARAWLPDVPVSVHGRGPGGDVAVLLDLGVVQTGPVGLRLVLVDVPLDAHDTDAHPPHAILDPELLGGDGGAEDKVCDVVHLAHHVSPGADGGPGVEPGAGGRGGPGHSGGVAGPPDHVAGVAHVGGAPGLQNNILICCYFQATAILSLF